MNGVWRLCISTLSNKHYQSAAGDLRAALPVLVVYVDVDDPSVHERKKE